MSNFTDGPGSTLEWSAVSGRLYNVYGSSNRLAGVYIDSGNEAQGFYKITVELEP